MDNIDLQTDKEVFDNFWYKARRALIRDLLLKYDGKNQRVLEIGCGAGSQLMAISDISQSVRGCDINQDAIEFARQKGFDVFFHNIEKAKVETGGTDRLCAFDVLEHIPDDVSALRNIYNTVEPGGLFFFSVPAFPSLFSGHDKHLQHVRRYGKDELKKKLDESGFEIIRLFYWNPILFPLLALKRLKEKDKIGSDINSYRSFNQILYRILLIENQLIKKGFRFPFGMSIFGVARKPK